METIISIKQDVRDNKSNQINIEKSVKIVIVVIIGTYPRTGMVSRPLTNGYSKEE